METIAPIDALKPYVARFLVIESDENIVNRRLPDTGAYMSFRYHGNVMYLGNDQLKSLPAIAVTGLRKSPRLISYSPGSGNVIVQFKYAGAAAFFDQPLNELFGATIPLSDLVNRQHASDLEEQFLAMSGSAGRVMVIEQFLL